MRTSAPCSRGPSAEKKVSLPRRASAPSEREAVRLLDHAHAEQLERAGDDGVAVRDPQRNVVERLGLTQSR